MPRVAFSAALSLPRSEPGTVPFDRVLLNDGDYYDPVTGKPESGLHWGNHWPWGGCAVLCSHPCPLRQGESLSPCSGLGRALFFPPFIHSHHSLG